MMRLDDQRLTFLFAFVLGGEVAGDKWAGAFATAAVMCILRGGQGILDAIALAEAELERKMQGGG